MTESIESKILTSMGITKGALELAERVDQLKVSDSNIDKISFSRHSLKGYADSPFLVATVDLKEPFQSIDAFVKYLAAHNLETPRGEILLDKDPSCFGFQRNGYTSDAFCAMFRQPYRLRIKRLIPN